MSGVIDKNGQQWEHCNHCGVFTEIERLTTGYSPKWPKYPWVDLCLNCNSRLRATEDIMRTKMIKAVDNAFKEA